MESLLGHKPSPEMIETISMGRHVTKETSPSLPYSTTADQTVNSMNATAYYDALKRAGVPVELHVFELGPHGTGMGQNLKGASRAGSLAAPFATLDAVSRLDDSIVP